MIEVGHYGPYRGLDEVMSAADDVAASHPQLVRRFEYGRSVEGAPLVAYRVSRPSESSRIRCLYVAGVHAMEWIGVETLLALLVRAVGEMVAGRLADRSITFVPVVNPDGYRLVEAHLGIRRWRYLRQNANGVDLNRNFGVHWSSRRPLLMQWTAPGTAPWSEPETRSLRDLAEADPPARVVSLHAFGGYFLYPYSGSRRPPPDLELHQRIGREMQSLQPRYAYRLVRLGSLPSLLWARGSEIDYFRDRFGALAFLIEVSRGGITLKAPIRSLHPFCWYNPRDIAGEVENVLPAAMHVAAAEI